MTLATLILPSARQNSSDCLPADSGTILEMSSIIEKAEIPGLFRHYAHGKERILFSVLTTRQRQDCPGGGFFSYRTGINAAHSCIARSLKDQQGGLAHEYRLDFFKLRTPYPCNHGTSPVVEKRAREHSAGDIHVWSKPELFSPARRP